MSINIKHLIAIPCNEHRVPLQKIDGLFPKPPPPEPKAVDDWSPFESEDHFITAEFLYCQARMSAANIDTLMPLVTTRQGKFLFKDHRDLYDAINAFDIEGVPWQSSSFQYDGKIPDDQVPEWMTAKYEIHYRDPRDLIRNIISDTMFKHAFDYVPYQEFDDNEDRHYENLMSGDWAFHQAACFVLYLSSAR